MARKLKLNPKVSYVLGLYSYNKGKAIGIVTTNNEIISIFVKTAMDEFKIESNKILVEEGDENETKVYFYNSKIKKLMDNALERRDRLFKYRNAYSASYFAGIFDVVGGRDPKGLYLKDLDKRDAQLLEFLNFHTEARGSKTYIMNENTFASFIREFSQTVR
jgi:hypothetical protein